MVEHGQGVVITSPPAQGCPGSHQEEACTRQRCGSSSGRGTSSHSWHLQKGQATAVSVCTGLPGREACPLRQNRKFKHCDSISTAKST